MFKFACTGALALATLLTLMWFDVLPGGWTLRGWVTPHAERQTREQARRSAERLAGFARSNAEAPAGTILWLGSSTIERFPLAELLPGHVHLNRGIGNESSAELLERLERSLPAAPPRLAVLYVGSIDFRALARPPERIVAATRAVIDRIRGRYADPLPVIVLGILPEQDMAPAAVAALRATNAALAALATDGRDLVFVDPLRPPIAAEDGSLSPDLAADRLHLNEAGYRQLVLWLEETGLFGE